MKNIKTKIAATAMTVLMAASLCACGGGYMGPVDDLISATNKKETDPMKWYTIMAPDFSADELSDLMKSFVKMSDDIEDSMEDAKEEMEEAYEECDDEFDKWKISFEEKKAKKLDEDDLEEYIDKYEDYYDDYLEDQVEDMEDALDDDDELEELADMLDIDEKDAKALVKSMIKYAKTYEKLKVTDGYEVKGKFILKSGKDTYETDSVEFVVLKINGSWVYMGIKDGSLRFEDDENDLFRFFFNELYSSSFYESMF